MGLASSRRAGNAGVQSSANNQAGVQSRRASATRLQSKKAPSGSGSTAAEKGRSAAGSAGGSGSAGAVGGTSAVVNSSDGEPNSEEENEEESDSEDDEDPDTLLLNFGNSGKKADLNLLLAAHARRGPMSDVCVVVDSGFSFTHIIPFYQGRALHKSVRRDARRETYAAGSSGTIRLRDVPCLLCAACFGSYFLFARPYSVVD